MHNRFSESWRQLLGFAPNKPLPEQKKPEAQIIHRMKREDTARIEAFKAHRAEIVRSTKWRNRRWVVLILTNLLFVASFWLDIQLLEGSLTASRFLGFHMIDLNAALQVVLAHKHIPINLIIGTITIFLFWALLGGRTFCSWVCPYHLLAEWTERLHLYLAERKIVSDHAFHRGLRSVLWLLFATLALISGYTVFETLSPTGILSRTLIYGPGLGLAWILLLLLFEVAYSRRAWCRYFCPIGLTYGAVGSVSPIQIGYHLDSCFHEGDCRKVCLVPHVLDCVIKGRASDTHVNIGADCTRCGLCVDACPTSSLRFEIRGLQKLL